LRIGNYKLILTVKGENCLFLKQFYLVEPLILASITSG
jgi:hypothetical protein